MNIPIPLQPGNESICYGRLFKCHTSRRSPSCDYIMTQNSPGRPDRAAIIKIIYIIYKIYVAPYITCKKITLRRFYTYCHRYYPFRKRAPRVGTKTYHFRVRRYPGSFVLLTVPIFLDLNSSLIVSASLPDAPVSASNWRPT